MPTITNRLAYAVAVNAADLVTHIEAEAQFRPVVTTLRLCNVFGQGDDAHITRLPKELVDMIGDELAAEQISKRSERRTAARQMSKCFSQDCIPLHDHITLYLRLALVNDVLEDWGEAAADSLLDDRVDDAEAEIIDEGMDWEVDDWKMGHTSNVRGWQGLVGKLGNDDNYGLFTKHREFLLQQYRLEVLVSHRHDGDGREHDGYQGIYTTLAYLVLPAVNGRQRSEYTDAVLEKENADDSYPVEDACTNDIKIPLVPSLEKKTRFFKMLTSLGLPGWKLGISDEEDEKLRKRAIPKLKLLTRIVE
ncbi:hypothetical protein LTS10_010271 [Elasticomyces elasticus]|nr:hypothetical protein LTS10_010271 [Elasticomyces elasticus]